MSILSPYFFASSTTCSGNVDGNLYSFINDNISTPAWSGDPSTSIIFPSAFFPFSGYFVICTTTLYPFFAFPILLLDTKISVPKLLSSGTTKPKFWLFWNVPTTVSFSCFIIFFIFPSALFILFFSSIISTKTLSPFNAFNESSFEI